MRRIGNAVVVDAFQRLNETVANLFEISEGKAAIVQMAVHHPLLQKFIHPFLHFLTGNFTHGARGAFHDVRQADDSRFLALRVGPLVTEVGFHHLRDVIRRRQAAFHAAQNLITVLKGFPVKEVSQ